MTTIQKLADALKTLMTACYKADAHEELSEFVDGSLLDAAGQALNQYEAEQATGIVQQLKDVIGDESGLPDSGSSGDVNQRVVVVIINRAGTGV